MSTQTTEAPPQPLPASGRPRTSWWVLVGAAVCAVLWLVSLPDVDLDRIDGWGLLPALPVLWYVSLAGVVALYLGVLLRRPAPGRSPMALHVVLIAVLYGTTSAIYDVPRFPYVYKHIGVVEYFLANGGVDRSIDIYNNFPGFFYLAAGFHLVTTVPVEDLAQWAQPVFALAFAGLVYWVAGSLTTSRRIRYGTALLFTLGDWVAQNYFAPQALAYVLSLLVVGGMLRTVPAGAVGLRWRRLARTRDPLAAAADDVPRTSAFWSSRWGALVLVLGFAAIAVSHQMSPVIVIVQSVVIAVLLRPAHPWLPLVFVLIEVAWLAQAWSFLTSNFQLFSFGGTENIDPPTVDTTAALPGHATVLWAAPALMAFIALLAVGSVALGVWRKQAAHVLVPALVGGIPLGLILGQPYGQEAIFRLYLFGLPWACYLIARWLFADRVRRRPARRVAAVVVTVVMAALLPPSMYGSELVAWQSPSDVAIARAFEQEAPEGSVLISLTPSFPSRLTADYPAHLSGGTVENPDNLASRLEFEDAAAEPEGLVQVARNACAPGGPEAPVYLALGPSGERFSRLYGLIEPEVYDVFVAGLTSSPDFELVEEVGDSRLFRCAPVVPAG